MAIFKPVMTTTEKLEVIAIKTGQLFFCIDGGIYVDINDTTRQKISDGKPSVIWVENLDTLNTLDNKSIEVIYITRDTNIVYAYNGSDIVPLSSTGSSSDVEIVLDDTETDVSTLPTGIISISGTKYSVKTTVRSIMIDANTTLEQELTDLKASFEAENSIES